MSARVRDPGADGHADGRTRLGAGTCAPRSGESESDPVTPLDAAQLDAEARLLLPPCDLCGEALVRKACAVVDLAAAARRAARMRLWRRGGSEGPCPPLVEWQLLHAACDPDRDWGLSYTVPIARLRSDRRLLRATLRVTSKPWARQTDWPALVVRIIGEQP